MTTTNNNQKNIDTIYRKLEFLKSTNKKLHINIISGADKGLFRNGFILDISLNKRCLVFIDDVLGELPYLFEEVDIDGIVFYNKKGENEFNGDRNTR